jgi:hypothetical protein
VMQLTKPKQNLLENSHELLLKSESKFLQLAVNQKVKIVIGVIAIGYFAGLGLLSFLWYRHQNRGRFHFFNDNPEWQQMDKFGHAYTSFYLSFFIYRALCYAGLEPKIALKYGGFSGALLMTPIEILDGFSEGYGASWGDELANFAGSAFFVWQQKQWGTIKLQPQFFFNPSKFAKLRPELLGKNLSEQWLKDYNGQIYWLKFNTNAFPFRLLFPFKLMLGYGAGNMIYGRPEQNIAAGFKPYREFYFGIDYELDYQVDYEVVAEKILPEKVFMKTTKFFKKDATAINIVLQTIKKLKKMVGFPIIWWKIRS